MGVSAPRFADLSNFSSSEADVRIGIICLYTGLELFESQRWRGQRRRWVLYLETGEERFVAILQPSRSPVLVNFFCERSRILIEVFIKGRFHFVIGQDRGTIYCGIWLFRLRRLLEEVHDFFELIF